MYVWAGQCIVIIAIREVLCTISMCSRARGRPQGQAAARDKSLGFAFACTPPIVEHKNDHEIIQGEEEACTAYPKYFLAKGIDGDGVDNVPYENKCNVGQEAAPHCNQRWLVIWQG